MGKNVYSLGLLRNGKVYANKDLAIQGLTQITTNDGVAKLARYLEPVLGGDPLIKTIVGFYANAAEMEEASGGTSSYTILDIEGSAADIQEIKEDIQDINNKIGDGIDGKTLTEAINEANQRIADEEARAASAETELGNEIDAINDKIGEGFDSGHTVASAIEALADAIDALEENLRNELKVSLEEAGEPTSGYLKTYILSQGVGSAKTEVGKIDIPKDLVVKSGSLVHGTWNGDVFTEDPDGEDTAIKLVIANQENPVYINTKDLVDFYTGGNGINVDNNSNVISLVIDPDTEEFLVVDANGLKVTGITAAIDAAKEEVMEALSAETEARIAADEELDNKIDKAIQDLTLEASDGISIAANKVKAVAASYSMPGVKNPITVDKDGIKFAKQLDCGFYDSDVKVTETAADIAAITNPADTDVFISGDEAFGAAKGKTFKNIEASDINAASETSLAATDSIALDTIDVTGDKGSSNAFVSLNSPVVEISNATVADGAEPYNVFEQTGSGSALEGFNATNVKVDDVALKHNVFNIYNVANDAVINISDVNLNLDVNNSNALRLANYGNATGVTVNFENVAWTYENTPNIESADFGWAGLIIYQPANADVALSGDLSKVQTWTFNFKNCKYNGVKVTANNFGEKNQVFYLYNINKTGAITDPVANGLTLNFE